MIEYDVFKNLFVRNVRNVNRLAKVDADLATQYQDISNTKDIVAGLVNAQETGASGYVFYTSDLFILLLLFIYF